MSPGTPADAVDLAHLAATAPPGAERVREVARAVRERLPLLGTDALQHEVERVLWQVEGLGPLETVLRTPGVTEVMVNGRGDVWAESDGRIHRVPLVLDAAVTLGIIERIVAPLGLRIDRSSPLVDARLPDGSRVNAVVPPLAIDGPTLTIRRFGTEPIPITAFAGPAVAALLTQSVAARRNILVAGGTGSGKTTLLNALASAIPCTERVITIEDAAELRLALPHVVRLEARPANVDGVGEVRIRDLVRNALRMRPDRIVVGEVRGGEAVDMLWAMNTGHEGSLSTCHANSAADALRRLETMVLLGGAGLPLPAVREQIAASLDVVVHLVRAGDGTRSIAAVTEVGLPAPGMANQSIDVRPIADGVDVVARWQRPERRSTACHLEVGP